MMVLLALGAMSVAWMDTVGVVARAQKLLAQRATVNVPTASAVVALGIVAASGPSSIPGLTPTMQRAEPREIANHRTGAREESLAARLELLDAEKELTRRSDELAQKRQELPWVRIEKDYTFETDEGTASFSDLFGGRSQLLMYHFMFGP